MGCRLLNTWHTLHPDVRLDHALTLVGEAADLVPHGALATEAVRVRGRVELRRGSPKTAHDLLAAEADRIEASNPGAAASLA